MFYVYNDTSHDAWLIGVDDDGGAVWGRWRDAVEYATHADAESVIGKNTSLSCEIFQHVAGI